MTAFFDLSGGAPRAHLAIGNIYYKKSRIQSLRAGSVRVHGLYYVDDTKPRRGLCAIMK